MERFVFDRYTLLTPIAVSLMIFFSSYFIFIVFNKYAVDDEESGEDGIDVTEEA